MDSLYTKKRDAQFRGPTTSDDYNSLVEENQNDLVFLYNKAGITEETLQKFNSRTIKNLFSLLQFVQGLENRLSILEDSQSTLSFFDTDQVDNDRFTGTDFAITAADRCSWDVRHGVATLPEVVGGSVSKVKLVNSDGGVVVPTTLDYLLDPVEDSADAPSAYIDTSNFYDSVLSEAGRVWERNVVVDSIDSDGAIIDVYVKLPSEIFTSADSNAVVIHPFPFKGVDLLSVEYTTTYDVFMKDADSYAPVNTSGIYENNDSAVGWVAPGAWDGDEILNCGPRIFYFNPQPVTGIKLRLRQANYYTENAKYIYSYGLSNLDVRLNKFLSTGKFIIRYDAPFGETISDIENVLPEIYNVSEGELPDVFDYRVIWETSVDSGTYTLNPVSFSQKIWVEVTLNKTAGGGTPALSGLVVSYS